MELARDFGDDSKPRAWSKYSKESSAGKKLEAERNKVNEIKIDKDKDKNVWHRSTIANILSIRLKPIEITHLIETGWQNYFCYSWKRKNV